MNSRSGAALIIAIVVLAALLILGLPFLFTQSGSLSGTRTYSHGQLASLGQDSAQSMGISAGASAVRYHWQGDGVRRGPRLYLDDWSNLLTRIWEESGTNGVRGSYGVNRVEFDTRTHRFALPGQSFLAGVDDDSEREQLLRRYPTVVGLAIEDESGKLDPNHIGVVGWTALLRQVGITDGSDGHPPAPSSEHAPLAQALANLRYRRPGGRITALEQLLGAEPVASADLANPRRSLTRTELERVRPFLTVSVPAQARGGLIDLGTVVGIDGTRVTIDSEQPAALVAFPVTPQVIGVGTTLLVPDAGTGMRAIPATGSESVRQPRHGNAIAIAAPPTVNLHQADAAVLAALHPGSGVPAARPPVAPNPLPTPSRLSELDLLGAKPVDGLGRTRTWFDLVAPWSLPTAMGQARVTGAMNPATTVDAESDQVVPQDAVTLLIAGDRLDRFPSSGYAVLEGDLAVATLPAPVTDPVKEYVRYDSYGALPQTASAARAGTPVRISVNRGSGPVGGPRIAYPFKLATLRFTAIGVYEQQQLGIASTGVITVASAATVTDPAGNQTAQDQHRVVAQALPQEAQLEARFTKQATLHALLAQRHGSLMTTFPVPYPRLSDVLPDDPTNTRPRGPGDPALPEEVVRTPVADPRYPDDATGMRPAVLRTLVDAAHLGHDWTLPFAGTSTQALLVNGTSATPGPMPVPITPPPTPPAPAPAPYSANDITPEGLQLGANRVLAYPNRGQEGLIRDTFQAANGALAPISGRQFSLWVRPDVAWTSMVALLDMRVPNQNVGRAYDGTSTPYDGNPGTGLYDGRTEVDNNLVSNRFSLIYDPHTSRVILVLNPGIIPFTSPFGPKIPRETYGLTAPLTNSLPLLSTVYPAVNPECLGAGGVHPMSCPSPITTIQHHYQLRENWTPGQWHLVQVAFSSNQPGGMSIIVDGLVGRDVSRLGSRGTPPAMSQPGDHLTLPTLVLDQDLPATPAVKDAGAYALHVDSLQLDCWAGPSKVGTLLPERGIIRIGNEYISYESITATGKLINCVRARRQRTDASVNSNDTVDWDTAHKLEAHRTGDLVVPGGFAIGHVQAGSWYRGGCQLAAELPDGDKNKRYTVWSAVPTLTIANGTLNLALQGGLLADFPMRGFVVLENQLYFYDNSAATPPQTPLAAGGLRNLYHWGSITFPDPNDLTKTITVFTWKPGLVADVAANREVVVASIELNGDPTPTNSYEGLLTQSGAPAPRGFVSIEEADQDHSPHVGMVQLYNSQTADASASGGRAEWLVYTDIDSRLDYPTSVNIDPPPDTGPMKKRMSFLLNLMKFKQNMVEELRPGFWFDTASRTGGRGRQRTAFAPSDFVTYNASMRFPIGTRVIPVQRHINIAYLLEAGDIITLSPSVMRTGERPLQMCVRYSAADAFPETTTSPGWPWNVMNRYFAFTEPMPSEWNPRNDAFHLLCWPCWTPAVDLSPLNTNGSWLPQRLGWVLPWGNAFAVGYQPVDGDPLNRMMKLMSTAQAGTEAMIDGVQAGMQPGWQPQALGNAGNAQANAVGNTQVSVERAASATTVDRTWLGVGPLTGPVAIRTDQPVFDRDYGIVEIGGETFAYKRDGDQDDRDSKPVGTTPPVDTILLNQAWLIGRALLGSSARNHRGPELVLHLPIGPVAEIDTWQRTVTDTSVAPPVTTDEPRLTYSGSLAAPAHLITSRNGESLELAMLPNGHSPPWLRGLYNTTEHTWPERVPSDPMTAPPPYAETSLAIGWWPRYPSGYPKDLPSVDSERAEYLRCRGYAWAGFPLRFHDCQFGGAGMASVSVLGDGDGLYDIKALALDATLDWGVAPLVAISSPASADAAFRHGRFKANVAHNRRWADPLGNIRTVDGAELRVIWQYRDGPLPEQKAGATLSPAQWLHAAARNGNRAPMIGPVTLRTRAPNKVLSVER